MRKLWALAALCLAVGLNGQGPGGPGAGGAGGDGIWRRNAAYGEAQTFDFCLGHQPGSGAYHYHVNPVCLRAQLIDNLVVVKTSRVGVTYQEKASGWKHSPILGWAQDGYPIYGPYGYSDPASTGSTVRRMVSGFQLRNISARTSLPGWSLANHAGISQQLTASQYGPPVSASYPLGRYLEDYDYIQGLGDLDQYNGRMTVTPDFPNGIYAYFVTIDASGAPAFPYVLAGQYYGTPSGGTVQTVSGTVQDYFNNGAYLQTPSATPSLASWTTTNSTQFAHLVSGFNPAAGAVTTWPGTVPFGAQTSGIVTAPTYAEIQRIRYSTGSVYVNANDMPGYIFGPWFGFQTNGGVFPNLPSSQNLLYQFPSTPAPAAIHASTGGGACGLWVNGVEVFNFIDGASYSNGAGADQGGGIVTPAIINVSAASFEGGPSAPNSIIAAFPVFNPTIATSAAAAGSPNWPSTLGGATVTVKDSAGTARTAQLAYASPSQLNFVVPGGTAAGLATVTVTAGGSSTTGALNIVPSYPNLFTVNASGLAAAYGLNAQTGVTTPIAQGIAAGSYLILAGTGLGNAARATATATVGGVNATVSYAGTEGTYPGLDQYNILIPASLAGAGKVDVIVTVAGLPSNTVNITIQ